MRALSAAEQTISSGLKSADALAVGSGKLDLGVLADWNSASSAAVLGGYADYQHRITESVSTFARAEAGRTFQAGPDYNFARATAGIRFRF